MPPFCPFSIQICALKTAHDNTLDFIPVFDKHVLSAQFVQSLTSEQSQSAKEYGLHGLCSYKAREIRRLCCSGPEEGRLSRPQSERNKWESLK